jgi:arylsulfatase A-like enzyme/Flp pilus assembly protein TadD
VALPGALRARSSHLYRVAIACLTGAIFVLVAASCGPGSERHVVREKGLSVVLITVDTLRADALSARTPVITRLAAGGVAFDTARAHNVVTLPSHANILAGRYPHEHGVRDNAGYRFPADRPTLATILKNKGYRTGAFVSAFPLDSRFGLDRGFDVYDDSFVEARGGTPFTMQERAGPETVALARRWIDAQPTRPFFCWIHLYEPHYPYVPTYGDDVAAADAALGPIIDPLVAAGERANALVVLTADHGESLGEHGEATHGIFGYEASLRVPLIFYQPRLWGGRVVSESARHVDILPTILDALMLAIPPDLPGRSLVNVMSTERSDAGPSVTYFEALSGALNRGWAPLYGVVRGRLKYIDLPIPELYDLGADPREEHNLADDQAGRVAEMRALLGSYRASEQSTARTAQSADTRERLRSLGYVASTAATSILDRAYTPDDDPKRLISLDAAIHDVTRLYLARDLDGAAARCRELVRQRPQMGISLLLLAQIERERGDLAAAIDALKSAVALNQADVDALALLGASLTEAGRARETVKLLAPHARQDSPDVQVTTSYALALARLGRTADALAVLEQARARDATSARILVEMGTVRMMAGDRMLARRDFEAALALNASIARAHTSLGIIAAEDGRRDEAAVHWREAVRLDPREFRTVAGMGFALARAGRAAGARPYFEFLASAPPPPGYEGLSERARGWLRSPEALR